MSATDSWHTACLRPVPQQVLVTSFRECLVSSVLDSAEEFSTIQTEMKPPLDLGTTIPHQHTPTLKKQALTL